MLPRAGSREPSLVWGFEVRAPLRKLMGAPEVPHGTSLLTRHHAQAPAVLDHSCALSQCDGNAGPALAGGEERGERNLVVLDTRDVHPRCFHHRGSRYRRAVALEPVT